jgi:NADH-ubiquinone oxidoreductase chain 4L
VSGLLIFSSRREHLLSVLLRLEYIRLGIFIYMLLSITSTDAYYSLFYLTFTACEGALGLSILILIGRTLGGDYFKSFNLVLFNF